jgi:hypothetical protein
MMKGSKGNIRAWITAAQAGFLEDLLIFAARRLARADSADSADSLARVLIARF